MGAPDKIESEWTAKGFMTRFDQILEEHKNDDFTYPRAYQQAEEEHVKLFGKLRFKSYESFREYRRQVLFPKR